MKPKPFRARGATARRAAMSAIATTGLVWHRCSQPDPLRRHGPLRTSSTMPTTCATSSSAGPR
ncbi:MAG: hypothetical protein MZV70_67635 [Desulfobacterales bacterium]|nr:hypothetical protein [Desulfobacterales bacterium]